MEHLNVGQFRSVFQAANNESLFVVAGIALRRHNDGAGGAFVPFKLDFVQTLFGNGVYDEGDVRLQTHHQRLTFRVAESDVVFQNLGLTVFNHQAGVENALEIDVVFVQRVQRRNENFGDDRLHDFRRYQRSRGVSSHSAGVRTFVVVVGAFVVLSWGQNSQRFAVCNCQNACLFAFEQVFNKEGVARIAELFVSRDFFNRFQRFLTVFADDYAFPRRQPVRLNDARRVRFSAEQIVDSALSVGKRLEVCGRDGAVAQNLFAEQL